MDEQTISMSVKQYTECIMALQKLDDIRRIVMYAVSEKEAECIVKAINRITKPLEEGGQDDKR